MTDVQIDTGRLDMLLDRAIRADLERRAYMVEGAAKRLVAAHGSGRVYTTRFWRDKQGRLRKGGRRVPHQASAPGDAPATDTGRLLNSIGHSIDTDSSGPVARIEAKVNYSLYLELGTRDMAPRPFMRPALRAAGEL